MGAILLEQNDEWAVQRCRYMTLETIAALGDDAAVDRRPWLSDPSVRRREIAAVPHPATRLSTNRPPLLPLTE